MVIIKICPYLEYSFQILGRKWNGVILHYLSICNNGSSHFTEIKDNIQNITPKALSLKLTELIEYGLIEKKIVSTSPLSITYELTEKGTSLALALEPIQKWALEYKDVDNIDKNKDLKGDIYE